MSIDTKVSHDYYRVVWRGLTDIEHCVHNTITQNITFLLRQTYILQNNIQWLDNRGLFAVFLLPFIDKKAPGLGRSSLLYSAVLYSVVQHTQYWMFLHAVTTESSA